MIMLLACPICSEKDTMEVEVHPHPTLFGVTDLELDDVTPCCKRILSEEQHSKLLKEGLDLAAEADWNRRQELRAEEGLLG